MSPREFCRIGLCLIFVGIVSSVGAPRRGSACVDPSRDLLVWVVPGTVQLPGIDSLYECAQVTFGSEEMQIALEDLGVEGVAQGFPDLVGADSVGTRPDGEAVPLITHSNVYRMRFASDTDLDSMAAVLDSLPNVLHANRVGVAELLSPYPNDSLFVNGTQWWLSNFGQAGVAGQDVRGPAAWSLTKGSPAVRVAVIDGGVTDAHPEFAGRIVPGSDDGWNEDALSQQGHGFWVAGVLGATANNRIGIAGLLWNASIIAEDITGASCDGVKNTYSTEIPLALGHAASLGAKVFNNSYAMKCGSAPLNDWDVGAAMANLYNLDKVIVAGMGNDGTSATQWPAAYGNTSESEGPGWG